MKITTIALIVASTVFLASASSAAGVRQRGEPTKIEAVVKKQNFWSAMFGSDKKVKLFPFFQSKNRSKTITARITYYNAYEDKWGSRVACSSKMRAREGVTVAAHPDFAFFKSVQIPALRGVIGNGNFVVQDRGSDVTSKKAAKGKAYVFDVFLSGSRKRTARLANSLPQYMTVVVN